MLLLEILQHVLTQVFTWVAVMAVEVSDTVPVVAFGFPVPLFHSR